MDQTSKPSKRKIKVSTAYKMQGSYFSRKYISTSRIILQGDYLQKANFHPNDSIEVLLNDGIITLKKV